MLRGRADRGQGRAGSRRPPQTRDSWNPRSRRSRGNRSPNAHRSSSISNPPAGHRSSGRRGSSTGSKTRCIPRPPPLFSRPSEWREEEEGRLRMRDFRRSPLHEERNSTQREGKSLKGEMTSTFSKNNLSKRFSLCQ